MTREQLASARAPTTMQDDRDKFRSFVEVLKQRRKEGLELPARTFYEYFAGNMPRILTLIVEDKELAIALLKDAIRLEIEREREAKGEE
jgi:hypothetical protein